MAKLDIIPSFLSELEANLRESAQFIQVVLGPRQVGKTTGMMQLMKKTLGNSYYFTADDELAPDENWIESRWQEALLLDPDSLLILDEIQKVSNWSQVVKKLWDLQRRKRNSNLRLVLLGSSSLELQTGSSESLAGRFQLVSATHWNFQKSQALSGLSLEDFICFGGYPGSYALLKNKDSWVRYIRDSIVQAVIGKDILQTAIVQKPALFKQAFEVLMSYPSQDISYTKLLGQLQDSGNTDLVKRYIELLEGAFLVKAVPKYHGKAHLSRSSSPKIIPLCGALINRDVFSSKDGFGRAFEAAVGACFLQNGFELFYWREANAEIDFVIHWRGHLLAVEVKSGRLRSSKSLSAFQKQFPKAKPIFITMENAVAFFTNPTNFLERLLGV